MARCRCPARWRRRRSTAGVGLPAAQERAEVRCGAAGASAGPASVAGVRESGKVRRTWLFSCCTAKSVETEDSLAANTPRRVRGRYGLENGREGRNERNRREFFDSESEAQARMN